MNPRNSAWYAAPIAHFLAAPDNEVLGSIVAASGFDVTQAQREAWKREIIILRDSLQGMEGWVHFEFDVPRLGSRVDAVILIGSAIIPVEFKVGERVFSRADYNQAWDYALDLKNFHAGSHHASIFPILVATEAVDADSGWQSCHADGVRPPLRCNVRELKSAIIEAHRQSVGPAIDAESWASAAYEPTPTIIEAARALYARHTVEAISRHDAGARNLGITSRTIEAVIEKAASEKFKAIIFVTGVPGAGKTLVGLNVATQHRRKDDARHAVFLSGNGPLVAVLRESLIRDEHSRRKAAGKRVRKGIIAQEVKPFIQNVHHFRDDGVRTLEAGVAPHDRVVIFDEAQRAWNSAKTADFMKRRKGMPGFSRSEPQFLIEYMDRHPDWAVIICLVGGGQEINTGEAGISTWLDAVREHFPNWRAYISPELSDSEYAAGRALEMLGGAAVVERRAELHLAVSMRSFRCEQVSAFVKALLDINLDEARRMLALIARRYPVVVSRELNAARRWVRGQARGSERYGLIASSGAQRLKPLAVDVRVDVDPIHWFLNPSNDTRSSFYLEDAATEYQIQGLELDWACVLWDADLRFDGRGWQHRNFNAKGWQRIKAEVRQQYLINAYRVLLTRARQGMVIVVPKGDSEDNTRLPSYYDATYEYLLRAGISELSAI
jgi:hypothetical protein